MSKPKSPHKPIRVSPESYRLVITKKAELEKKLKRIVAISEAVDDLLRVRA